MIRKILFLAPICHTLASGKDFSKFCTDLEIQQGTTLLRAKCDSFQKIKTDTEIDLYNCVPCGDPGAREPCPWAVCEMTPEVNQKQVGCYTDGGEGLYNLGGLLLLEGRAQIAHILDRYITNRDGGLICDKPFPAPNETPLASSTPPSSTTTSIPYIQVS
jgi:hypothetical protein